MTEHGAAVNDGSFVATIDGDEEEVHAADGLVQDVAGKRIRCGVNIGDELVGAIAAIFIVEIGRAIVGCEKTISVK